MDTMSEWSEGYREGLRCGIGWAKLGLEYAGARPGPDEWQRGYNEGYRLGYWTVLAEHRVNHRANKEERA